MRYNGMLSHRHDASFKGIFVQRSRKGFTVTFPYLANIDRRFEGESILPIDCDTFTQAVNLAGFFRSHDTRLVGCHIFLLDNEIRGKRASSERYLQLVG